MRLGRLLDTLSSVEVSVSCFFFLSLEVVPVGKDLVGRADRHISEDMRMTEDQLFADAVRHIIHVEHALSFSICAWNTT